MAFLMILNENMLANTNTTSATTVELHYLKVKDTKHD